MSTAWKNRTVFACILLLFALGALYLFYAMYWEPKQMFDEIKRSLNFRPMPVVFTATPAELPMPSASSSPILAPKA